MNLLILISILLFLMIIGAPLYISLLLSSFVYFFLSFDLDMITAMQKMASSVDSFPLLAIPLFIYAGQLMNKTGITTRIFGFADSAVGHFRGGLGYVNILSSYIFSGMSGSALADIGGLGAIEIKAMEKAGYDKDFSYGLTIASSVMGPIVPPSIPLVIFGVYANVSIGALFFGGFIPGLLMVIALSLMTFFISRKRNYIVKEKLSQKVIFKSFLSALPALMSPVLLIGGIWSGWFTPTEAAMICILYTVIVSKFIYKEFSLRDVPNQFVESARMVVVPTSTIVGCVLFGWILNYEQVGSLLLNFFTNYVGNVYVVLIFVNIIVLILGFFMDATPVTILVTPVLLPLLTTMGIHPVHFGVFLVVNMMIGLLTPPIGHGLFMLTSITGDPMEKIVKMVLPWYIPLIIVLLLITYVPELVLFIPRLAGFIY